MGRPRIFINTSIYPDDIIETLARIFYDDLMKDLNNTDRTPHIVSKSTERDITTGTLDIAN